MNPTATLHMANGARIEIETINTVYNRQKAHRRYTRVRLLHRRKAVIYNRVRHMRLCVVQIRLKRTTVLSLSYC